MRGRLLPLIFFLCLAGGGAPAEEDQTVSNPHDISKEDMEIIKDMEILNLMDLLEDLDLIRDLDILIEDERNANAD
jgi:hypothetical protein